MFNKSAAAVLQALWWSEGLTRRELTSMLGLSRPTVDKAIKELLALDLITPLGRRPSGGGRPALSFMLNATARLVLGVDLELPHLDVILADLRGLPVKTKRTKLTGDLSDPLATLSRLADLLRAWTEEAGHPWGQVAGVGVGVPGFIVDGLVSILGRNLPTWLRVPAQKVLEERLGVPVQVNHDVHFMALAEAQRGGWNSRVLLYLALRPGLRGDMRLGASLLLHGEIYPGAHGNGATLYRAFVGPEELEGLAGEALAERLAERLTSSLVHAVTLFDPDRVVIQAEALGDLEPLFLERCRRHLEQALAGEFVGPVEVVPARVRGPSGAQGAAIGVVQGLARWPERLFDVGRG